MLLHGNFINSIDNEKGSATFLFWGEKGSTLYKRRGKISGNALPIYPGLAKTDEVIQFLGQEMEEEEPIIKNISAVIFRLESYELSEINEANERDRTDAKDRTDWMNGSDETDDTDGIDESNGSDEPGEVNRQGDINHIFPYEIKGVAYTPWSTLSILLTIEDKASQQAELELAPEIIYWARCAKFALELIVKHRYYPEMGINKQGSPYSYWSMLADRSEDKERLKILCTGMPPSCRAVFPLIPSMDGLLESYRCPGSGKILESFINWLINYILEDVVLGEEGIELYTRLKSDEERAWVRSIGYDRCVLKFEGGKKAQDHVYEVYEGHKMWKSSLKASLIEQPFRTCFRITPPEGKEKGWKLDYLLQARDDQSLLVSAEEIWKKAGGVTAFLQRNFGNPQERLLEDLSIASRVFEPILESLYSAKPTGCILSTEQAYSFFKEGAVLLEENGFGIIAPSWWKKPANISLRLKVGVKGKSQGAVSKSILNLNTLLEYDWKAAIGDVVLSDEDFKKLSKLKVPLVRVRGEWVQLNREQIEKLEEIWKRKGQDDTIRLGDILRMGLGNEELVEGIPVDSIAGDTELADFMQKLSCVDKLKELPPPEGLCGKLRPYQKRGFSWLAFLRERGIGACLADDMGLGKTVQLISLALFERQEKMTDRPTLLICPTSVVGNWIKELEKFAPGLKVMLHHGQGRKSGSSFTEEALCHDMVISTYSLVHKDEEEFKSVNWAGVVLDEAQNIKNPGSKQTMAVKKLRGDYRIALTGTPVENRLSELWSIMDFLNPGYLGNNTYFRTHYAVPIEKDHNAEKAKKLKSIIAPFVLRRLKTDPNIIKDLPEKIETKVYCGLTKEQATLYEAVVQDMLEKIEESVGIERKGMVLAALSKLKQICNHPVQFLKDGSNIEGRSGKLERLFGILEEILAEGDKVLIFTQFAEMGQILKDVIKKQFKADSYFLYGGVPRKTREKMIESFQNDKKSPQVFILSLKAGGVGLNLTRASHVVHFDRWWNPAVENQATDRAFRIGQKKNVQVHKFICSGTLEERIDKMLDEKRELAETIVGTGEEWLTEMTTKELGELMKLNYNDMLMEED
ncbi:MAG: DEAD/DEAH box helicase [Firmicutes bacterium]|nr:DEAD/DEAH box helicase [Bacillota bacterium]